MASDGRSRRPGRAPEPHDGVARPAGPSAARHPGTGGHLHAGRGRARVRRIPSPSLSQSSTGHTVISIFATSPFDRASTVYVPPSENLARKRGPVLEAGIPPTDHLTPPGSSETAASSTRSRGKKAVRFAVISIRTRSPSFSTESSQRAFPRRPCVLGRREIQAPQPCSTGCVPRRENPHSVRQAMAARRPALRVVRIVRRHHAGRGRHPAPTDVGTHRSVGLPRRDRCRGGGVAQTPTRGSRRIEPGPARGRRLRSRRPWYRS